MMVSTCRFAQGKVQFACRMLGFILIWLFFLDDHIKTHQEPSCGFTSSILWAFQSSCLISPDTQVEWSGLMSLVTAGTEGLIWKWASFFSRPVPENIALCFPRRLVIRVCWCSSRDTVSFWSFMARSWIPAARMLVVIPVIGTSGLLSWLAALWC